MGGNSDVVVFFSHTAFKNVSYAQGTRDLFDVLILTFKEKGRSTRDDVNTVGSDQGIENLL